MKQDTL